MSNWGTFDSFEPMRIGNKVAKSTFDSFKETPRGCSDHNQGYDEEGQFYQVSPGNTKHFHQTNGNKLPEPEKVIADGVIGSVGYPFNTYCSNKICTVKMKLSNNNLRITHNSVESIQNIFVEVRDNTLYIWSSEFKVNRQLTTKGDSIVDGFNIHNFDGKRVKVGYMYDQRRWSVGPLELTNLELRGTGNTVTITDNIFDQNTANISVYGDNIFNVNGGGYLKSLKFVSIYNTNITRFDQFQVDDLDIELQGSGKIDGLEVVNTANVKIIGGGTVMLKAGADVKVNKTIFGTGKLEISR